LMAPMPAMMREAVPTLMMKAKVGFFCCCCDIGYDPQFGLQGEDWDELERKAAKCKANLLSKCHRPRLTAVISQRTRNGLKLLTKTRMTPIDRRKRHQPNRRSPQLMAKANAEDNARSLTVHIVPHCYVHLLCFVYVQCRSYAYVRNTVIHLHFRLRQPFCVTRITVSH
jgi:hypothetical protein